MNITKPQFRALLSIEREEAKQALWEHFSNLYNGPSKRKKKHEREKIPPVPPLKEKEINKERENDEQHTHTENKARARPRSFSEFQEFITEQKLTTIKPRKVWAMYQANGWTTKEGRPIQDWKAFITYCHENNLDLEISKSRDKLAKYPNDFREALKEAKANNPWFFHTIPLEKAWANWNHHGTPYNSPPPKESRRAGSDATPSETRADNTPSESRADNTPSESRADNTPSEGLGRLTRAFLKRQQALASDSASATKSAPECRSDNAKVP